MFIFYQPETDKMRQFLEPETERKLLFLGPGIVKMVQQDLWAKGSCQKHPDGGTIKICREVRIKFIISRGGLYLFQQCKN